MSLQATSEMAAYCFAVVSSALRRQDPPLPANPFPTVSCPIFVCYKESKNGHLRGCIGSFASKPLHQQLVNYAKSAAFEDRRFSPIQSEEELKKLKCTVSLLHSFEDIKKWDDWVLGTHGIQIEFEGEYHGTFLPSVAPEQGWTKEETLVNLVRKTGYRGVLGKDLRFEDIRVVRYQESSACCTYEEAASMKR